MNELIVVIVVFYTIAVAFALVYFLQDKCDREEYDNPKEYPWECNLFIFLFLVYMCFASVLMMFIPTYRRE